MTDIDISTAAVARMLDGVTEGPWVEEGPMRSKIVWAGDDVRICFMTGDGQCRQNAAFIAYSRSAVPALAAERDAAVKRAEKAEAKYPPNWQAAHEHYKARAEKAEAQLRSVEANARALLSALDAGSSGSINPVVMAACFGAEAFMASGDDGAPIAMARAFLAALIDPLDPALDYLRADPAAGEVARAERKGGAA